MSKRESSLHPRHYQVELAEEVEVHIMPQTNMSSPHEIAPATNEASIPFFSLALMVDSFESAGLGSDRPSFKPFKQA